MMQTLLLPNATLLRPRLGFRQAGDYRCIEITDILSHCVPRRDESRLHISSARSEANRGRRPRRNQSRDKTSREDDQDEIIALFRRIQSSLSKDGPAASTWRRRNAESKKDKQIVELIPEFPRLEQARRGRRRGDDAVLSGRSELLVGETSNHAAFPGDAKAATARPVSNFVKKSPISRPVPSKQEDNKDDAGEQQQEAVPAEKQSQPITADRVLQNLDRLKLPELKEIAKGKGMKGYSKMKKVELLQLLKGLPESK